MLQRCFAHAARFVRREGGPTAIDYAVLLALIVLASLVAITAFAPGALTPPAAPAAASS